MRRVIILIIVSITSIGSFAQQLVDNKKINYKEIGAPMPPVKLVIPLDLKAATLFGSDSLHKAPLKTRYLTNEDISKKKNTFLMLFNPTCEHCADQTQLFIDSIHLLKKQNTQIVMVAGDQMMSYLEYFDSGLKVSKHPETFTMGVDSSGIIDHIFMYQMLPQINIYDKKHNLIKVFTGGVPMDSLKIYLK